MNRTVPPDDRLGFVRRFAGAASGSPLCAVLCSASSDCPQELRALDGGTNGSLQDRDTLSVPGARQRNSLVARVVPGYRFSPWGRFVLGVSGQQFQADFDDVRARDDAVTRWNVEAEVASEDFAAAPD